MTFLVWLPVLGCASNELVAKFSAESPIDVVVVPGCPTQEDGSLSEGLKRRVLWAAHLFEQGLTRQIIVSGAAVHNRYVEALALAAGLAALGVPPQRIWLEPHARHTDENMFYALALMDKIGVESVAVASRAGHALGGCSFFESWHQPCVLAPVDDELVAARLEEPAFAIVHQVRIDPVPEETWQSLEDYEAAREAHGGVARPSSPWLYLTAGIRRLLGSPWIPPAPPEEPPEHYCTWLLTHPADVPAS